MPGIGAILVFFGIMAFIPLVIFWEISKAIYQILLGIAELLVELFQWWKERRKKVEPNVTTTRPDPKFDRVRITKYALKIVMWIVLAFLGFASVLFFICTW